MSHIEFVLTMFGSHYGIYSLLLTTNSSTSRDRENCAAEIFHDGKYALGPRVDFLAVASDLSAGVIRSLGIVDSEKILPSEERGCCIDETKVGGGCNHCRSQQKDNDRGSLRAHG